MLDLKRRKRQVLAALLGIVFLAGAAGVSAAPAVAGTHTDWTSGGFNIANTRSNPFESTISTKNANRLAVKWTFTTHGDVSATPAVVDGAVYFPDWGGYLNFYDDDGDVIAGYRPRFNALNLFAVPQQHNVSFVPPFAAVARYAITGWFRDR